MPSTNSNSTSTARDTPEATKPDRGNVRRDGGKEHLPLPSSAAGNVVVTDMTNLAVMPPSGYDVVEGRVVRRGGTWAAGEDRWLVEYDRAS